MLLVQVTVYFMELNNYITCCLFFQDDEPKYFNKTYIQNLFQLTENSRTWIPVNRSWCELQNQNNHFYLSSKLSLSLVTHVYQLYIE